MKGITFIVVLSVAALAAASVTTTTTKNLPKDTVESIEQHFTNLFNAWKSTHNKSYRSQKEHEYRFAVFKRNVDAVNTHNRIKAPVLGWTKAINKFGDMTSMEFRNFYNGFKASSRPRNFLNQVELAAVSAPSSVDWRSKGAVTPVKNQQDCGSCWSFSTTGAVEGFNFIKKGKLVSLSEQNLIDCSTSEGNQGCNGGSMDYAFQYIISNPGIDTEASYPYEAQGPNTCQFDASKVGATITAFKDIPQGDEKSLAAALATIGPVSVAVDASEMQFYSTGIYAPSSCSSTDLDHGILAVGYDNTVPSAAYYIVKNSWGADWGLDGYIHMAMNKGNMCGIATQASLPTA